MKKPLFALTLLAGAGLFYAAPVHTSNLSNTGGRSADALNKASLAFNEIARKAMPAVVSISVVRSRQALEDALPFGPFGGGLPFGPGGGGGSGGGEGGPGFDDRSVGLGSGVIIRPDGHILTNHHVIENAERITVTLDEKHKFKAKLVGADAKTDLAVIKIDSSDLPVLTFGDSQGLKVGDWAVAIGSPFGLSRSVSSGIISAKSRAQMGILDIEDFIQTDAAINPGSSGGPLLNLNGEMIGINTAIFSEGAGFVGIGFAIPSRIAHEICDQLVARGKVLRGWAGMSAQDMNPALARHFHAESHGALISDVVQDGPAQEASIKAGDVIQIFNGTKVADAAHLKKLVGASHAGSEIQVMVVRGGKQREIKLKIREQPVDPTLQKASQKAGRRGDRKEASGVLGLGVEDVPPELAPLLQVKPDAGALVIEVEPGSPAFDAGLAPGDVILKAGEHSVHNAKEFREATSDSHKAGGVVLYVQRGPQEKLFFPIEPQVS